jgi:hypothetical protein
VSVKVGVERIHDVDFLYSKPQEGRPIGLSAETTGQNGGGMTHSGQFFILVEWILTQAHDHGVDLGLVLVERTRRWAVDVVIGTTSRDLGVAEVYAQGCDVHHLK